METSKRRSEIITYLCQHRFSTVGNLANEFGVSERTIRRDIEFLSLSEPIYTQSGRYGGGVYIMDNYYSNRGYFTKEEVILMKKILDYIERISTEHFTADEVYLFKNILKMNMSFFMRNLIYTISTIFIFYRIFQRTEIDTI